MKGLFITFEGTEGSGKSTQVSLLAERLRNSGHVVRTMREPGGTAIGEEIRHTLKHSLVNHAMTPEAELLLMNASRAQLVREVIRPSIAAGDIVLCDRFFDSTVAYQGHGRQIDLKLVKTVVDFAVGDTIPDLTLLVLVPPEVSAARRLARQPTLPFQQKWDRIEEAGHGFFERVAKGYEAIAAAESRRMRRLDGTRPVEELRAAIWDLIEPLLKSRREPVS